MMPTKTLPILVLLLPLWCGLGRPASAQDAAAGEKIYKTQCMICHANVAGKKGIGPTLFGVVGRPAGSIADFKYTDANKTSGLIWDAPTLDRYLKAPRQVVPNTAMTYQGLSSDDQRMALISYLATLK